MRVEISLRRANGVSAVRANVRNAPIEVADATDAIWAWTMQHLADEASGAPPMLPPWDRGA